MRFQKVAAYTGVLYTHTHLLTFDLLSVPPTCSKYRPQSSEPQTDGLSLSTTADGSQPNVRKLCDTPPPAPQAHTQNLAYYDNIICQVRPRLRPLFPLLFLLCLSCSLLPVLSSCFHHSVFTSVLQLYIYFSLHFQNFCAFVAAVTIAAVCPLCLTAGARQKIQTNPGAKTWS